MAKLTGRRLKIDRPTVATPVASFNTAIGGGLSQGQQVALTKLFRAANELGIWDTAQLLNLFLNDAELSKFNLLNAAKFKLSYPNGITVDATGVTANGTNQYYSTGFRPSLDGGLLNDFAIDIFVKNTTASGAAYAVGVSDSGGITAGIQQSAPVEYNSATNGIINTTTGTVAQFVNMSSHSLIRIQLRSGLLQIFEFGQKVTELSITPASLPGGVYDIFGFCKNTNGNPFSFSSGTHKHLCIGRSLSDSDVQKWTQALLEYHIAIGRIGKSIVFNGDSITHGMNVSNGAWPELLCNSLGLFKQNFALSGSRMSEFIDMTTRSAWWVPKYNAAVHDSMYLALGTNDRVQSMSGASYGTYLTSYLNLAVSLGWPPAKLYIIARYYQKGDTQATLELDYHNAAIPICASFGAKLTDPYTAMKNSGSPDTTLFPGSDGTHPNDAGQVFLGNYFLSVR